LAESRNLGMGKVRRCQGESFWAPGQHELPSGSQISAKRYTIAVAIVWLAYNAGWGV